jgi:hypothetical protein
MAMTIRITDEGEPVVNAPVVMLFDGMIRKDAWTDLEGKITFEQSPGSSVHLTVSGIDHGVRYCGDGLDVDLELSEE